MFFLQLYDVVKRIVLFWYNVLLMLLHQRNLINVPVSYADIEIA